MKKVIQAIQVSRGLRAYLVLQVIKAIPGLVANPDYRDRQVLRVRLDPKDRADRKVK